MGVSVLYCVFSSFRKTIKSKQKLQKTLLVVMSSFLKIADARSKSKDDLLSQLRESKQELSQLRVAKQTQTAASKVAKIRVLRKNVARILTVLSQKERDALKVLYAKKPKAM